MCKRIATIYAVLCTLLLATGCALAFYFAFNAGNMATIKCLIGIALGFILSPIVHEFGHVSFGVIAKMDCVYVKCFCFKVFVENGRKSFGFASPFAADETQAIPKFGGNMKRRAALYTLGGLIFSGVFVLLILLGALLTACFATPSYMLIAMLPYACYLCILNLLPFEYASGKTDMLVYQGIKAGKDAERCMISVMEIQGQLYEGKSFSEIDEKYYFELPQLCEDEPLYSAILDLRYRFYLEKGFFEKAADCLNRLALNQDYLSFHELEKIAGELVYMHVLNGDMESAEKNYAACQAFLKGTGVTPKRILASYAHACGNEDAVGVLLGQAYDALASERIEGVKKFEEILLSRLKGE